MGEEIIRNINEKKVFIIQCVIGNVFCKLHVTNYASPLIFTFSNSGDITNKAAINDENYLPWGYSFCVGKGLNTISFSCLEKINWFRDKAFFDFLNEISSAVSTFSVKLAYGSSMGGYAAGAFAELLNVDRVLLLNPISTLCEELVPWESRFKKNYQINDWSGDYADGSRFKCPGIVVYDPLFHLDRLHAKRYNKSVIHLKIPGVGHMIPVHMQELKLLKLTFESFLNQTLLNKVFYRRARNRRKYLRYYNWLLSDENIHLTESRAAVIIKYKNLFLFSKSGVNVNDLVNILRDSAILNEETNVKNSIKLMRVAHKLRPEGKVINEKLKQYMNKV